MGEPVAPTHLQSGGNPMSKYMSMIERVVACSRNDYPCMLVYVNSEGKDTLVSADDTSIPYLAKAAMDISNGMPLHDEDDPRREDRDGPR